MYAINIKKAVKLNTNFRQVLQTGEHSQIVVMSLKPGEEIGSEIHPTSDQLLFFVDGTAKVTVDGDSATVGEHDMVAIPAGARHNVQNISKDNLKLFTVYAPATHADGLVHATKADAAADA